MKKSADLYINNKYCGFYPVEQIENIFRCFSDTSLELSDGIDWDEIILYAVMCYDAKKGGLISAGFSFSRMSYPSYIELCSQLPPSYRLFFRKKRRTS